MTNNSDRENSPLAFSLNASAMFARYCLSPSVTHHKLCGDNAGPRGHTGTPVTWGTQSNLAQH